MKKIVVLFISISTLIIASLSVSAQSNSCDRACLADMLDQYLNAVVSGDPSQAPLFIGFRQTENSTVIPPGDGIWATVHALGAMQRRFYDPVTGNAAYFGILEEDQGNAVAILRMRVENREITEAEWHIGRRGDAGINGEPGGVLFNADNLTANPPPERSVPQTERLPRAALIAIANSYFDGITNQNAAISKAHPGCIRWENGQPTTGNPLPPERLDDGGLNGLSDCRSGTSTFDVALVAARRFGVVDEEAQVVVASVVFIRTPGSPKRRNHFTEVFYIDEGLIRAVYAAMFYVPPTQAVPNWPPYESNFPLAADFGQTR